MSQPERKRRNPLTTTHRTAMSDDDSYLDSLTGRPLPCVETTRRFERDRDEKQKENADDIRGNTSSFNGNGSYRVVTIVQGEIVLTSRVLAFVIRRYDDP
jgi:hypothetical protein